MKQFLAYHLYVKTVILTTLLFLSTSSNIFGQEEIILNGKELFGDLSARQIGPGLMSGRISDLEGHPTNNRILYAGTAGGGVWKSSNGGASFDPIFDDYIQSIGKVCVDPHDPDNTIYVGTGEIWTRNSTSLGDGLYKTIDGGQNWKKLPFEGSERISNIIVHPKDKNTIYVGELGALWGDSETRGVFKSTDGGQTWNKIFYVDQKTGCSDLIMDPNDPNILYASMWEFRRTPWSFNSGGTKSGLFKSTDGGKTWNELNNGFPKGKLGRIAVAVAPSNPKIIYSVIESENGDQSGLYRSEDSGTSWKRLNGDFGLIVRPFYFSRIVVDPQNPDILVKAGLFGSISRDGGKTFKSAGNMHADIHDIHYDKKDSDRMYFATDGGVYRTWDGGTTLDIVENIPVSQFYHITLDNEEPYNIYGGLQDNGSWYGPSSSPGGIEARDWNRVGYGDGFRVLKHSTKPILYSEMQGAENVWRYDIERNQQKTIQPLATKGEAKLRFNWNAPITLSPNKPDRIYIGSQFLHVSDDMGNTWKKISKDLTTNDPAKQDQENSGGLSKDNSGAENHCTIFTIAESSLDENIIWVGTDDGNVQVTKNNGKAWDEVGQNITGLPKNTWCYHIEPSVHDKSTAYAVFDGHTGNDKNPYSYKTTDYGKTWTSIITEDVKGFTRCMQEDLVNPDLLFLGTETGLYITINGGQNWSKFTNNMPSTAVHHMEMHAKTNDLVMATHGRGVIILDDISPLRELTKEVIDQDVFFFEQKPFTMVEESGFGGGSTELQFVGPNRNRNARIIYYLKKRHIFGKMKIELFDEQGKFVKELDAGKAKGINIVTWDYMLTSPKMAKGKTFTFGGFTAPRASAGTYSVVMTKGKERYESKLKIKYDENSLLTAQERKNHKEITQKLFDMTEDLAFQVYQMDEMIEEANKYGQKSSKAKMWADEIVPKLTALKESSVITTGDNYVGQAEPELREKLATLYAKVASGFVPPTASEMDNLNLLEGQFNDIKKSLKEIQEKDWAKLMKLLSEEGVEAPKIMDKKEFLDTTT